MDKSNFMFFRNTPTATMRSILSKSGFRETSYLGTYLGVPLSGKSPKIKDFCYLYDEHEFCQNTIYEHFLKNGPNYCIGVILRF